MNDKKRIFGLIGYPVDHSLSPVMHNAGFRALGINAEYRLFEVSEERLKDFLIGEGVFSDIEGNEFNAQDIEGFNITIPYKVRAKEILEKLVDTKKMLKTIPQEINANKYGAVNTVRRKDGNIEYCNTDGKGFWMSLWNDLEFDSRNKTVIVFGCGGAGRTIGSALSMYKNNHVNKLYMYDLNPTAVDMVKSHFDYLANYENDDKDIIKRIEFVDKKDIPSVLNGCDLLVNASSLGMKENDSSVVDKQFLHKGLSVYDIIYHRKTQLLKDAESVGCKWVDGRGMLLYQGIVAFIWWLGPKDNTHAEPMKQALYDVLDKGNK
ncbi:MAG: shikimate dehydrogenase [Candidatus Gygaella obscura]|nr:shikimate dehydrogenase [Candidatus Gygaella obscura]